MKKNSISPAQHGTIDSIFSKIQLLAPAAIGMKPVTVSTYRAPGTGFLSVNAFTDTTAGMKRHLSFKDYQKGDVGFLTVLSLLTFT